MTMKARRTSARLRGLQSEDERRRLIEVKPSTNVSYVPPELFGLIAEYFEKSELKQLRLVSQHFYHAATPRLFDRIYISPRHEDIEVFREITSRKELSCYIKSLHYDVSHFQSMDTQGEYLYEVCRKLDSDLFIRATETTIFPQGMVPLVKDFKRSLLEYPDDPDKRYPNTSKWLANAYAEWNQLSLEEVSTFNNKSFFTTLVEGLSHMTSIKSLVFDNYFWNDARKENEAAITQAKEHRQIRVNLTGSLFCRSWQIFYPIPKMMLDCTKHVDIVFQALSDAGRKIRKLKVRKRRSWIGFRPTIFNNAYFLRNITYRLIDILDSLQELTLQITPFNVPFERDAADSNAFSLLPSLLAGTLGLKKLVLSFS